MNLLYLTPYLPVFGSHGLASKAFDDIALLSSKHKVRVVCFVSPTDEEKISCLENLGCEVFPFFVTNYSTLPHICFGMKRLLKNFLLKKQVDILQCEEAFMARYLPDLDNIPSVLTKHQIFPLFFWREFKVRKNPLTILRIIKNILEEKEWLLKFKRIIFFSEHDKNYYKFLIKSSSKIRVIPLGVDLEYFSVYNYNLEERYDACFLGNFSNYPNLDAVFYFIKYILPLIRKYHLHFSLLLLGNIPSEIISRLKVNEDVFVKGYVRDIRPYLAMSKIFINPMRLGSGMRRKLLEAWAMAKPIVSTTIGCEGLNVINGENILIADKPSDFVEKVKLLMENREVRNRLGEKGRITVEKYHNRQKIVTSLENVYLELLSQ